MRALKESLEPAPVVASFANTGIYPWDPEKILEKARLAFPRGNPVLEGLPSPAQEMMQLVSEASPRGNKVAVTRFQKHGELSGKLFSIERIKSADERFQAEKVAEAATKAAQRQPERRVKKRGGGPRSSKKAGKKRRGLRRRGSGRRLSRNSRRETANNLRLLLRHLDGWRQWLWCEYCDEVCLCTGCQKSGPTITEFAAHEKPQEID